MLGGAHPTKTQAPTLDSRPKQILGLYTLGLHPCTLKLHTAPLPHHGLPLLTLPPTPLPYFTCLLPPYPTSPTSFPLTLPSLPPTPLPYFPMQPGAGRAGPIWSAEHQWAAWGEECQGAGWG